MEMGILMAVFWLDPGLELDFGKSGQMETLQSREELRFGGIVTKKTISDETFVVGKVKLISRRMMGCVVGESDVENCLRGQKLWKQLMSDLRSEQVSHCDNVIIYSVGLPRQPLKTDIDSAAPVHPILDFYTKYINRDA